MSKCDIRIELDTDDHVLWAGDSVSGRVVVTVDDDCLCDSLRLTRLWRTHGRGNGDSGAEQERVLFQGGWQPGQDYSYPFTFEIPETPLTYHGRYLNVDWYLKAVADIPWSFDPKAEAELVVRANPDKPRNKVLQAREEHTLPATQAAELPGALRKTGSAMTLIGALLGIVTLARALAPGTLSWWPWLLLPVGAVVLTVGLSMRRWSEGLQRDEIEGRPLTRARFMVFAEGLQARVGFSLLLAAICVLALIAVGTRGRLSFQMLIYAFMTIAGGVLAFRGSRRALAERKLGEVSVSLDKRIVRAADTLSCSVSIPVKEQVTLKSVRLELLCQEVVTSGSGTNRTTHRHVAHHETVDLAGTQSMMPSRYLSLQGAFRLPDDAAPSFESRNNELSWSVGVSIDVAGWPDWERSYPITVGA